MSRANASGPSRLVHGASPRRLSASLTTLSELAADALVGFAFSDARPVGGALGLVDWYLCGTLAHALHRGVFGAEVGERLLLPTFGRLRAPRVFVFGLGPLLHCDGATLQRVVAQAAPLLPRAGGHVVAGLLPDCARCHPASYHAHMRFCAEQIEMAFAHQSQGPQLTAWIGAAAELSAR